MHRLGPWAAVALFAALDALWAAAAADCTCRAPGRQFQLGQTACLTTPNGPRLATCAMVLNNSSWAFSESPCTVSDVAPPGPARAAQAQRDRAIIGTAEERRTFVRLTAAAASAAGHP